jgi:hypothetical protein
VDRRFSGNRYFSIPSLLYSIDSVTWIPDALIFVCVTLASA